MKRLINICSSLLIVAAVAGCGGTTPNNTGTVADMAMAAAKPDLASDMAMGPVGKATGEPCTANADCAKSVAGTMVAATCIKASGMPQVPWPGGYCTSPCRLSKTDMTSGLNSDCPSDSAACQPTSQTAGRCVKLCMTAADDCRAAEGYVCEFNTTYAASCTAKASTWCDPSKPTSCAKTMDMPPKRQICVNFSPDNSAGSCEVVCDVFAQDCAMPMQGANDCIAEQSSPGDGTCIPSSANGTEGQTCHYLNDCGPGLQCNKGVCRQYCRDNGLAGDAGVPDGGAGNVACPMGQKCGDLSMMIKKNVIGICAP